MRCPRSDGELIGRSAVDSGGMALTYHICLGCLGHWIAPFDANYLPLSVLSGDTTRPENITSFRCPECHEPLERAHQDAMAPDVLAWYCSSGHGYFFPRGNLAKFRAAQEARVTYHKLWNIPLPAIRTVLLGSVVLLAALTAGIAIGEIQRQQVTETQAKIVLDYQNVVITNDRTVLITAHTLEATQLFLSIPALALTSPMDSSDGLTHTYYFGRLNPGSYTYTFSYVREGKTIEESFTFSLP